MSRTFAFAIALIGSSILVPAAQAQATPEQLDQIAKLSAEAYDKQPEVFAEAQAWLKDEAKHVFANKMLKREDGKKLVDDLYAAGAVRVYAAGLVPEGDKKTAAILSVVVGGKPAVRAKVYSIINDFYKTQLKAQGKPELLEALVQPDAGSPIVQVTLEY
jgi:aminoglycoside phosphotransferase family enzyme